MKMQGTRAQSAMEYLTTYGWAILIIAALMAVLYSLNLFNPSSFAPSVCLFPADFSCISTTLSTSGTLSINIQQATSTSINVTAIGCNAGGTYTNMTALSPADFIDIGGNMTFTLSCYSGGAVVSGRAGTLYEGYVVLNYTNLQTGFQHSEMGKITQKIGQ